MKARPQKTPQAVALAIPRADGPMQVAVLAMALGTLVTFAILAAGWQLGGLLLGMMGRA